MPKRLQWFIGEGLSIDIGTSTEKFRYDGEKLSGEKNIFGSLDFIDEKDVVRFCLHVAKSCGLTPHEFAVLSNQVINEMGDWK